MKPWAFPVGGAWVGATARDIDGRSVRAVRKDWRRGMMVF